MWEYINLSVNIKTLGSIILFIINIVKRKKIEIKVFNIIYLVPSIIVIGIIFFNNIWQLQLPYLAYEGYLPYMFISFIGLILLMLLFSEKNLIKKALFSIINPICYFCVLLPLITYG
jgi:hypothetical protein